MNNPNSPPVVEEPKSPQSLGENASNTGAGEANNHAASMPKPAQPFKLPYSNDFPVVFKDIASSDKDRQYSEPVSFGPLKWRLLIFPKGNKSNRQADGHMSCYLDVAEADYMEKHWRLQTQVTIILKNQFCSSRDVERSVSHKFHADARDIGYAGFHPLTTLYDPYDGFYVNNELRFHIKFTVTHSWVERPDSHQQTVHIDSKKVTGFVGLQNQGATCYLNSLLQSLYHLPRFRHLVYSLAPDPHSSASSLQRLFWNLEHDSQAVSTAELTKSFGWNIEDLAVQHDVQELLRKLVDNLEEKVKSSPHKGTFEQMFKGAYIDFIKCINIPFERKREEAYCDLSLNVAGCETLEEAFSKFTETELLTGDNKYKSENDGYQDANKGIKLHSLPPVLHLHLKRFGYNFQNEPPTLEKVNAKQIFPPVLKLGKYFYSPKEDSDETTYQLHGILVHAGSAQAGHYYAFLRPSLKPDWFKFDDSKVLPATLEEAIDDNFGGDEITEIKYTSGQGGQTFAHEKNSSAYMLVYVRKPDLEFIFSDATSDMEKPFLAQMEKEKEEQRLAEEEKIEQAKYTHVRVSTWKNIVAGPEVNAALTSGDLTRVLDVDSSPLVKIKKDDQLKHLKVEIEKQLKIPRKNQRLWKLREVSDPWFLLHSAYSVVDANTTINHLSHYHGNYTIKSLMEHLDVFVEELEDPEEVKTDTDPIVQAATQQPHLREDEEDDSHTSSFGDEQKGFPSLIENRLCFARYWNPLDKTFAMLGSFYLPQHSSWALLLDAVKPLLQRYRRRLVDLIKNAQIELTNWNLAKLAVESEQQQQQQQGGADKLNSSGERIESTVLLDDDDFELDFPIDVHKKATPKTKPPHVPSPILDDDSDLLFFYGSNKIVELNETILKNVSFSSPAILYVQHRLPESMLNLPPAAVVPAEEASTVPNDAQRSQPVIQFRDMKSYVEHLLRRVNVLFREVHTGKPNVTLELTTNTEIADALAMLGKEMNWDPKKIRLFSPITYSHSHLNEIDVSPHATIHEVLQRYCYASETLAFELLDVEVSEARGKNHIKINFVDSRLQSHLINLHLTQPTLKNVLIGLRNHPKSVPLLSDPEKAHIVLYEVSHAGRKTKEYIHDDEYLYKMHQYFSFYAEELSPEDFIPPPEHKRIPIYLVHISNSGWSKHTHPPFHMTISPQETVLDMKARLQSKLNMPGIDCDVYPSDPARVEQPLADEAVLSFYNDELYVNFKHPSPTSPGRDSGNGKDQSTHKPRHGLHLD